MDGEEVVYAAGMTVFNTTVTDMDHTIAAIHLKLHVLQAASILASE